MPSSPSSPNFLNTARTLIPSLTSSGLQTISESMRVPSSNSIIASMYGDLPTLFGDELWYRWEFSLSPWIYISPFSPYACTSGIFHEAENRKRRNSCSANQQDCSGLPAPSKISQRPPSQTPLSSFNTTLASPFLPSCSHDSRNTLPNRNNISSKCILPFKALHRLKSVSLS